jgi:glucose/arabinose dehydrogenase
MQAQAVAAVLRFRFRLKHDWPMFRSRVFAALTLAVPLWLTTPVQAGTVHGEVSGIIVPAGFHITRFSDKTPNARSLALADDGTVFVGTMTEGKVYALQDKDGDGYAETVNTVLHGLNVPNGVAWYQGDLYVAEVHRIIKLRDVARHLNGSATPEVVYSGFPSERHHGWKYLRIGPDRKLYAPVGAPCNICVPSQPVFASLTRMDPDGSHFEIYAQGLRNSVGFDWLPGSNVLYATDNGRDYLGDDTPADELNRVSQTGQHFGYPWCHGGDVPDPEYGKQHACREFEAPAWKFPAHVAPLGIRFYQGKQFPASYQGQLFVAQHGSWNREQPQGYRVVLVRFQDGKPVSDEVFASGWLHADGKAAGRPVDILEMPDGALLVSDDLAGAVYRISYR